MIGGDRLSGRERLAVLMGGDCFSGVRSAEVVGEDWLSGREGLAIMLGENWVSGRKGLA